MPSVGPICSARSSLVLMGLPTTRSSMFMKDRAGGFVTQGKGDLRNECAPTVSEQRHDSIAGIRNQKKPTSEFAVGRQSARWSEPRDRDFTISPLAPSPPPILQVARNVAF